MEKCKIKYYVAIIALLVNAVFLMSCVDEYDSAENVVESHHFGEVNDSASEADFSNNIIIGDSATGNELDNANISNDNATEDEFGNTDILNNSSRSVETQNYAVYASRIIESSPGTFNQYVHWETNVSLTFPQIYYANYYKDADYALETHINRTLFLRAVEDREDRLTGRDNRDLTEYSSDYEVTYNDDDLLSIRYFGYVFSIFRVRAFCQGVTVNVKTGEIAELPDYYDIGEHIIDEIESGDIKYHSYPGYDKEFVLEFVSKFIENYDPSRDTSDLFYLDKNNLCLIIPVSYGNSNYFVLEIPRNDLAQ